MTKGNHKSFCGFRLDFNNKNKINWVCLQICNSVTTPTIPLKKYIAFTQDHPINQNADYRNTDIEYIVCDGEIDLLILIANILKKHNMNNKHIFGNDNDIDLLIKRFRYHDPNTNVFGVGNGVDPCK